MNSKTDKQAVLKILVAIVLIVYVLILLKVGLIMFQYNSILPLK